MRRVLPRQTSTPSCLPLPCSFATLLPPFRTWGRRHLACFARATTGRQDACAPRNQTVKVSLADQGPIGSDAADNYISKTADVNIVNVLRVSKVGAVEIVSAREAGLGCKCRA